MRFLKNTALAAIGGILVYAIGMEVAEAPHAMKVPPGATLVTFGEMAETRLPDDFRNAAQGDFLKGVPGGIRCLDHQRVAIQGFMIPTRSDPKGVEEFLLVRGQASCCFGIPPAISEVMEVRMSGSPVKPLRDRVVNVVGLLHVRERWAGQWLGSLFQLDGESVTSGVPTEPMKQVRSPQEHGLE